MFHQLLSTWFAIVQNWGYAGVFFLMALESSIVPVPSEIVMPPAAFWAAQGQMNIWGVLAAGTAGSFVGSIVSYVVSRWCGEPIIRRFGKFIGISAHKMELAHTWITDYGVIGIFAARLLPVIRHLISIPAGILKMDIVPFSLATTFGAFLWCGVLSWFGKKIIGRHPELLSSPDALVTACKQELSWIVFAALAFTITYVVMIAFRRRTCTRSSVG